MGPPAAAEVLRNALFRGADDAVLLTDRAFAGADTLATSYALSKCASKIGKFDLILCGRQAIDGDTAQVGPQIAEKLKLPQISYVEEVLELTKTSVKARRAIEGGYEILESPTPALFTVVDANEPRPEKRDPDHEIQKGENEIGLAASKTSTYVGGESVAEDLETKAAKGLLIREWSAADVEADPGRIGFAGSPTKVKQIQSVVLTAGDYKAVEATEAGVSNLIHELIEDHTLG